MEILVLCSANICRSPMAAALLERRLVGVEPDVWVTSAGWLTEDQPTSGGSLRELARRGLDGTGHRSRRVTPALVAGADLVVTMERAHAREAVLAHPQALPRVFTLKELVRRAEAVGPRRPDEPFGLWLERVGEGRRAADLLGAHQDDDVADPIGRPARFYARAAAELEDLIDRLVGLAFPAASRTPGAHRERT